MNLCVLVLAFACVPLFDINLAKSMTTFLKGYVIVQLKGVYSSTCTLFPFWTCIVTIYAHYSKLCLPVYPLGGKKSVSGCSP